jgi:hypothetical protein
MIRDPHFGRCVERGGRKSALAGDAVEEVSGEQQGVPVPAPERRHVEHEHRQSVVEIRAESPCGDEARKIVLCRGDQLHVDRALRHRSETPDPVIVERRQELSLQGCGQRIDLVEEQRAAPGGFEQTILGRRASVKAPASKPNISASSSVSGMAAAFWATNGLPARGPLSCEDPREQSLTGSRLASDQDGGRRTRAIEVRQAPHLLSKRTDRRGFADQPINDGQTRVRAHRPVPASFPISPGAHAPRRVRTKSGAPALAQPYPDPLAPFNDGAAFAGGMRVALSHVG